MDHAQEFRASFSNNWQSKEDLELQKEFDAMARKLRIHSIDLNRSHWLEMDRDCVESCKKEVKLTTRNYQNALKFQEFAAEHYPVDHYAHDIKQAVAAGSVREAKWQMDRAEAMLKSAEELLC